MKILITGAEGFIGQHLVKWLLKNNHEITALHYPKKSPPEIGKVNWLPCDLSKDSFTDEWPIEVDSVIYLAQSELWRNFPKDTDDTFNVNLRSAFLAMDFSMKNSVKHFLYASTGGIYTQRTNPSLESDLIDVFSINRFYEATKLSTEILLRQFSKYINVVILRLFAPYGPNQHPKMLFPNLIERVKKGEPINLQGKNGLTINPIYIDDVSDAISRLLYLNDSQTINIGGNTILNLRQIGDIIGKALGEKVKYENDFDAKPPFIVGDINKLKTLLDWEPTIDFSEGLNKWLSVK